MLCWTFIAVVSLLALCAVPADAADFGPKEGPLMTRWAKDVDPAAAHPEYPRPQMARRDWMSLNGVWSVALQDEGGRMGAAQPIVVPFPIESALSGVMERSDRVRYRRTFEVPAGWAGRRILLNFEAVDWEATVSVNGRTLGTHRGGFDPFSYDITDALRGSGAQTLEVEVFDPTDAGDQPRGKQIRRPHGIWYTPATGIWYSVWLEPVPEAHIADIVTTPDVDAGALDLTVETAGGADGLEVLAVAYDGSRKVGQVTGAPGETLSLRVPNAKLWSPGSPHLYRLKVSLRRAGKAVDAVDSYFGMRKVAVGKDERGITRLMLNGKPVFQVGPLDQGYWPDGILTPPTEEAMKYDIKAAMGLGFNMIRKHVKVEPRRWYYWTDKLGVLVWQDMPSANNSSDEGKKQFEVELRRMVETHRNHPSIIMWVPFNEGWGQYDTERITAMVEDMDPSRLVNNASGWTDMKVGDVYDTHSYPMPAAQPPEETRASVVGEFGGYGLTVPGHMWQDEQNWGYRNLSDANMLATNYEKAFRRVWQLKDDPGISAVVYTQITDVEIEANGLLTYDRAVLKAPKSRIVAANTNRMPPAPTPVPVVASAQQEPLAWQYTLDQPADDWMQPGFAAAWTEGPAGFGREGTPGAIVRTPWTTPNIWLRRTFNLPAGSTKDLYLWIHHDEDADVYLNGVLAARLTGFLSEYQEAPISAEARATLRPGANVIAIHARNTEGGQYIDAGLARMVVK